MASGKKFGRFPVDPFVGCDASALPVGTGLPSRWFWPKAQVGNTHPGACLPFGLLSACAYTGGYPTGYSLYRLNSHAQPPQFLRERLVKGITHIHPSGTGAVGHYYNFLRVTPLTTSLNDRDVPVPLAREEAAPGYYSYTRKSDGVQQEVTVSRFAAIHRITFPSDASQRMISITVTQSGLDAADDHNHQYPASDCRLSTADDGSAGGVIHFGGLPLYFAIHVTSARTRLWCGQDLLSASDLILEAPAAGTHAGLLVSPRETSVELAIGFSFRSIEAAIAELKEIAGQGFELASRRASQAWNRHLGAIEVDGPEEDTRLFYSLFHHALKKPAELTGHGPLGDAEHYVDFATLWDQYKTQLPLVLSLYPGRGAAICNALINIGEYYDGHFPIAHLLGPMDSQRDSFQGQGNSLAHLVLFDAFVRQLPGIEWPRAIWLMHRSLMAEHEGLTRGESPTPTHILDFAHAAWCTWRMARQIGEKAIAEQCERLYPVWHMAYNTSNGLILPEGQYYEGTYWNYSFRLQPDMRKRLALLGPRSKAVDALDRFFGFGQPPVEPLSRHGDHETAARGMAAHRFEGMNNESDMETAYAYHYLGRPDRTAEIVTAAMRQCYAATRGGLPGNDDSGALSSWFVWNAVGIFPVAGQNCFLVGSPLFDAANLQLGEGRLEIRCTREQPDAIYVTAATLDGHPVENAELRWEDLQDSRLELTLSRTPDH